MFIEPGVKPTFINMILKGKDSMGVIKPAYISKAEGTSWKRRRNKVNGRGCEGVIWNAVFQA